ncbi:MAG: ATP-dependent Clp protease ATP-binding subunit [Myxococcales bacterium]|nr:ATP-dependent Clp protease ATP-binding subunit [Myxococcales bacterium]
MALAVDLSISIFQRKRGRNVEWYTLGLGAHNVHERGPNQAKVQQRVIDALRKALAKRWPRELEALDFVRGRRLEFLNLELNLPGGGNGGGGRRRVHGVFPVIIEPRARGPGFKGEPIWIAYHPLRQREWFVHEESRALRDEATVYFRERWGELEDDAIELLKASVRERATTPDKPVARGKQRPLDRLTLIALRATPRELKELLEEKKEDDRALIGQRAGRTGDGVLAELGVNQTLRAIDGRLEPGSPRAPYREQLRQLLCGARKSSVLLVGPSGVGKSALVSRAIHDLLEADGYVGHRNLDRVHSVWQIRGRRIIAGMSYLGQWEQRCVELLETAGRRRAILWVDDLHAWGRIGESRESERSLATFFRGPVARRELIIIGECTPEQLQQLQDDGGAFASGLTIVRVGPTSEAETMRLIIRESRALEQRYNVFFDPRTFRTIFDLGGALGSGAAYPGKALDLLRSLAGGEHGLAADLHEAEAQVRAGKKIQAIKIYRRATGKGLKDSKNDVEEYMRTGRWPVVDSVGERATIRVESVLAHQLQYRYVPRPPEIGPSTVVRMLSYRTGMPQLLLSSAMPLDRATLRARFASQIVGQEDAIGAVCDLVLRIKAGLVDAGRPYGVFLFTGPTGTGKTEMAKCVAEYLYGDVARLLRFDMSEYNGPDAAARLIGDRWRPVGALTGQVRAQPFSVVLLDEVEKADPRVLNLMLQLFDDGRLTDAAGSVVDFSHAVVIMTSNLGARSVSSVGFAGEGGEAAELVRDVSAAVREFFPPELFNRIDRVVQFSALSRDAARGIATRELARLLDRRGLTERSVFVRFTPAVVDMVVREGFNQRDGARSLKRFLEDRIGGRLADTIAATRASGVRVYWLYMHGGALNLHRELLREAEARGVDPSIEDLLEWNMGRLLRELPDALARVDALLAGPELTRLGQALSASLERFRLGRDDRADAADAVYNLDTLRAQIVGIRERLATQVSYDPALDGEVDRALRFESDAELLEYEADGTHDLIHKYGWRYGWIESMRALDLRAMGPALPMRTRPAILEHIAELFFLERALEHADDADQHAILIELTRISRTRGKSRFEAHERGLLEDLYQAYASGRGERDGLAFVQREGDVPRTTANLNQAHHQIVLRLLGPAVRAFYMGEQGCHVRHSISGASEVVRVRVLPARRTTPAAHVSLLSARREAFERALEQLPPGAELPENPDGVLPIVRRYRYDPPEREGTSTRYEVEDYPLAHAATVRGRALAEVLRPLWMLRLGAAFEAISARTTLTTDAPPRAEEEPG